MITDFDTADRVYNITQTIDRLATAGKVSEQARRNWLELLVRHSAEGSFQCTLTAHLTDGRKPADDGDLTFGSHSRPTPCGLALSARVRSVALGRNA